ncbi:MAG: Fe-S cluster assembly protein SufD, partial [Acidobacteria bacterium]|nr:Fe-S cluster assembly protein SufD [Acidobacteriota bacterium]
RSHALLDLNVAAHDDALVLTIARGVRVAEPVRFALLSAGRSICHPRLHVVLEEGAEATLLDVFASTGSPFTNSAVLVSLAEGAILRHVRVQDESQAAFHTGLVAVDARRGSRYLSHAFAFGGVLSRHEIDVRLLGEGAEALLDGLFVAFGTQSSDQHLAVTHAAPRTSSRQRYRGILGGEARGAFDGKVVVAKGATHTEAHQMNRNLLLSQTATVDSKPQLEIENNDVKASHASTTGRLNDAALFYLRARGIGEAEARALLTRAFASEIVSAVPIAGLVPVLEGLVTASLGGSR